MSSIYDKLIIQFLGPTLLLMAGFYKRELSN